MSQDWKDALGMFYIIQLRPEEDALLVKVGWTADLPVRFWQHRMTLKAPMARVVSSWPCLRGWERRAIFATVGSKTRPVFGEQYRCDPVSTLEERAQRFFQDTDRTAVPCPPFVKSTRAAESRRAPVPVRKIDGDGATAADVAKQLGVPRYAVYRMAESGRIPGYPQPRQPWHSPNRKRWLFKLSEVEAAYAKLAKDAAPPPAPDAP